MRSGSTGKRITVQRDQGDDDILLVGPVLRQLWPDLIERLCQPAEPNPCGERA
ncbi:MAG: hypothetical protein Q8J81_00075 [Phenylobacterium sp.]|nr:hypothetical protein [Phenylobacterium sp.]MDP2212224.1 hypothetical protein [Phenylobacterium sp.]